MGSSQSAKSPLTAAFFGIFFGPLGLLYVGIIDAVVGVLATIGLGAISGGLLAPLVWIACGGYAYGRAEQINKKCLEQKYTQETPREDARPPTQPPKPSEHPAGHTAATSPTPAQTPTTTSSSAFCGQCGSKREAHAKFCQSCGERLAA